MAKEDKKSNEPNGSWVKTGDLNMHYLDWGDGEEVVITLHGAASSCHRYDLVIPKMQDAFRLISIESSCSILFRLYELL